MNDLTVKSFFQNYITHPLSKDLTSTEKKVALVASIVIGIISLGLAHFGSFIYQAIYKTGVIEYGPNRLFYHELASRVELFCSKIGQDGYKLASIEEIGAIAKQTGIAVPQAMQYMPLITECSCARFDRTSNDRRKQIENKVVQDICTNNPNKVKKLELVSFGAGEGLQDFIIIGRLAALGYSNIHLSLIDTNTQPLRVGDPGYGSVNNIAQATQDKLRVFYKQMPSLNITVDGYTTTSDFLRSNPKNIHAVWSEDIERPDYYTSNTTWPDILALRDKLHQNGHLYMADSLETISFAKTSLEVVYGGKRVDPLTGDPKPSRYEFIQTQLQKFQHLEKLNISYYCRNSSASLLELLPFLIAAKNTGQTRINLKVIFSQTDSQQDKDEAYKLLKEAFARKLIPGLEVKLLDQGDHSVIDLKMKERSYVFSSVGVHIPDIEEEVMAVDHLVMFLKPINILAELEEVTIERHGESTLRRFI